MANGVFDVRLLFAAALAAAATFADAEEETATDGEKWNVGVDAYRAGDAEQALAVMRPLMSSKTHGSRAAEVVAKLEYDAAHDLAKSNTLEHLEAAAVAAQQALAASPADKRANENFTRAIDGLKELRETAHANELIEAAQGKDPSASVKSAMDDARLLLARAKADASGAAESISAADEAEAKAMKIADVWIPLKDFIQKNVTNEAEAAASAAQIDEARALTLAAAKRLGDMDPHAADSVAMSEDALSAYHKALVLPPEAIGESLASQSNAWAGVRQDTLRTWSEDALAYTKAFRSKFDQWADAYSLQAQANTNMPPLTAEIRDKIKELAERLETEQTEAVENPTKENNAKALETAKEVAGLMPIPPPQQNKQNQQQKDNKQQQQDQQQQQEQNQDQQQSEEPQESEEQKKEEDQPRPEQEKSAEEKEEEAILRRIQEKSAEHEEEKRRMMGEGRALRDW